MKRPVKKEFENYAKNYKRRKTWQRVVSMLTCIIVFCTTYALILPAITLSGEAACGMEEHVHADACYEAVETKTLTCSPEHVHTADCYEEGTLICGRADFVLHTHNADCCNESGDRICTLEKLEEHTHTDDCYTAEETVTGHLHADSCYSVELGENVCNLEEQEGHTHEDSCYGEQHLTCEQAEREGHTHTAACYGEATLSCGIEEDGQHTHTDACCTAELRCGETEDPGHTHGGDCYSRDVICCQEESEGHAHSDACREEIRTLTCQLEEDGVIAEELVLICTKPEVTAHTHTDACYEITEDEDGNEIRTLICTELEILEHVHTAECAGVEYKTGSLICTDEEHVHTEECFQEVLSALNAATMLSDGEDATDTTANSDASQTSTSGSTSILDVDANFDAVFSNTTFDPNGETFEVDLKINFDLNKEVFEKVLDGTYDAFHIALPGSMIIPDDLLNTVRSATDAVKDGMVAFDYWFEKTSEGKYVIHIDFRDDYVERMVNDNSNGKYDITFSGTVDKSAVTENGELKLVWSDGTTTTIGKENITYPDDETLSYDLHTQKQGTYNVVDNTLTYTVKVYSDKGTPSGNTITVTDTMTLNGITIPADEEPTVAITAPDGSAVSGADNKYQLTDGKPTIEVTNLPALDAGGYYLITYTYKIDEITAGSYYTPYNRVTATTPNPENDKDLTSTTGTSVRVSKVMIGKTGAFDAENGLIIWTITVNAAKDDITGYVLTDEMLQNALSLTITPADTSYYAINRDSNNKISSIEFTAPDDETNTNTYTITYTTAQDQSTVGGYTTNDAILKPPTTSTEQPSTSGDVNVWIPASGGIDKAYVSRDGGVINWSVTINIPDGGIGEGTVIKDNTGYGWDSKADNHWMTSKQIYDLNETLSSLFSGVDYTLEFSADGWNWCTYSEAIADTSTTKYYCWRVTFNEDVPGLAGQNVTIDYSTTADLSAVTSSATYVNTASMGDYSDTDSTEYKPNVAKLDRYYNSGTTSISSTDGVIGWYIRITPDEAKSEIKVTDYLPAGVTLTKIGVGSDGNAAKSASGYGSVDQVIFGWEALQGSYTLSTYEDTVTTTAEDGSTTTTKAEAQKVEISITSTVEGGMLPADKDIYVYFECTIDDMPEAGASKSYSFTNEATVDGVEVEQTQNVTVTIPATVLKMDRDGSIGNTTHSYNSDDPTLGWYIRIYLPDGASDLSTTPIVVTDTLPDGLKLTKIGIGSSMYDARYGKDYSTTPATDLCVTVGDSTSGDIHGSNNAYVSTYSISGQTVTVNITNGGKNISSNSYIYIYLECQMTDSATGEKPEGSTTTTYTFPNSATVTVGGETLGTDDHTQEIIKNDNDEQKAVDKSSNWDSGINQLQYSVLLNENGVDLDNNPETSSIKVVDEMIHAYDRWWNTKHSTLISSSVKLYYAKLDDKGNVLYDTSGNPLTNGEVPADLWSWTYSDNYEDVLNYQTDQIVNTITAMIPDETPVVLKYIYEFSIDSDWDTSFVVTNKATVYGETVTTDEVTTNDTWKYSSVSASATSSGTYTIHKVKQGNYNITLPGAEFTVYTYSDGQPLTDGAGNVVVYTSDANGLIKVSREDYFAEDVVYYITETKAPDGYAIPENSQKFYFYFSGDAAGNYALPDGAIDLSLTFGVGYVENEVHESVITVTKAWLDADGNAANAPEGATSITFQLIQTDIYGNEVIYYPDAEEGMTDAEKVYTISAENSWQLTLAQLPAEDAYGNAYTYTAKEIAVDGYVSEVSTDENGNITITNRPEDTTSISVQKAWNDANMTKSPVQVQLYQSVDTLFDEYTAYMCYIDGTAGLQIGVDTAFTVTQSINGAGTYTFRWDLNLFGFKDTVNADAFYIDVVDPKFALDGYTITNLSIKSDQGTYGVNGNFRPYFSEHGGGYKRINFYNIYDDAKYMDVLPDISSNGYLEVSFTLVAPEDDENNGVLPDLNEFVSVANTGGVAYGTPVTLDSSNEWAAGWSNLPLYGVDSNGNVVYYSYYVKEVTDGYDVRYSNSYAVDEGTIIVTNYPKSTAELTVDKQWLDADGKDIPPPESSVSYDLYQEKMYVLKIYKGGWGWANEDVVYVKPGTTITLTFIGNTIVEPANYQQVGEPEFVGQIWEYGQSPVALYKYTFTRTITDEITSIGMNYGGYTTDNWATSTGYDMGTYDLYDANGNKTGEKITLGSYELLTPTPDDYTPQFEYVGTYTLSESNNWSNTHEGLAPAWYKVVETTTGYQTTYIVGDGEESTTAPELELEAGEEGFVTINNRLDTTEITISKSWLDDGQTRYNYDMLTFILYQDGVQYSTGTLFMEKDTSGNYYWQTTITDLPKSHPQLDSEGNVVRDDNGEIVYVDYVYTVKENSIDGYITKYSANGEQSTSDYTQAGVTGDGTITIINEQRTSIGVKKYWADGVSPTAVRMELWCYTSTTGPVEFQVPLDANGQVDYEALKNTENASFVRYASICDSSGAENSTASSSKTFKNLALYEFSGETITKYYTYFIVEVASGYVKTYTEDNFITGGSYTITNDVETVDISVNKIWSDGSTTAVDVSLYQVFTAGTSHVCTYDIVVTEPTCTAQGYSTYTCICGHTYVDNYTDPNGHNWNSGVVTVQPTETTTGTKLYTCFTCGETREETLGTLAHTHSYTSSVTTDPTCTEQGVETYTCSCGDSYTKDISATGHSMGEWTEQSPATCTTDGTAVRTCSKCGTGETKTLIATGHTLGTTTVTTAPTCISEGVGTATCTSCNQTVTVTIPATGEHDWDSGTVTTQPSETETGIKTYTCQTAGCGATYTEVIPATGEAVSTTLSGELVFLGSNTKYTYPNTEVTAGYWVTVELYDEFDDKDVKTFTSTGTLYTLDPKEIASRYYYNQYPGWSFNSTSDVHTYVFQIKEGANSFSGTLPGKFFELADGSPDYDNWTDWDVVVTISSTVPSGVTPQSISYTNRMLYSGGSSNSSNPLGGTWIGTEKVTPGTATTWTDLPKYKLDENGNIIGEYTYYVVETGDTEYDATYAYGSVTGESAMSTGISSGTITITNHQQYSYELPATGGSGTFPYTLGGIFLLMAGCAVLMYNHKKGRKGVTAP